MTNSTEKASFRIFSSHNQKTDVFGIVRLHASHGCNGKMYTKKEATVWIDEKGEVEFSEDRNVYEEGSCDGSCQSKTEGFFHNE